MIDIPTILFASWLLALICYIFSIFGLIRTKKQKSYNTNSLNQIDQLFHILTLGLLGMFCLSILVTGTGDWISTILLLIPGLIFVVPAWLGLTTRLKLINIKNHASIIFNDDWSQFELTYEGKTETLPNSTETKATYLHFNNPRTPWGQYGILLLGSNGKIPVSTMTFDFPRYEKELQITVEKKSVSYKEFNNLIKAL